jgi:hypothetical protein
LSQNFADGMPTFGLAGTRDRASIDDTNICLFAEFLDRIALCVEGFAEYGGFRLI